MEKVRIHYINPSGIGLYVLQKKNCKNWKNYNNIGKEITPLQFKKFKYSMESKWEIILSSAAREAIFNQK